MQPIHELLSQIRWDPHLRGEFEVAFTDHEKSDLQRVPVRQMRFTDSKFAFEFVNADDQLVSIPLHRIREVYRNQQLIWSRPDRRWPFLTVR